MGSLGRNVWAQCRKIVCVGRNYAQHAKELGNAVPREPVLFLKPPSCIISPPDRMAVEVPQGVSVHHEVELAVVIGPGTHKNLPESQALGCVKGYACALDMTARSLQDIAKSKSLPWTISKGLDTFCPLSPLARAVPDIDPGRLDIWLNVDGVERQRGNTADMIFTVPFLVSHISRLMRLEENDVILTGTPAGVGPVRPGQVMTCGIEGPALQLALSVDVVAASTPLPVET